jgi:hypothetical protein
MMGILCLFKRIYNHLFDFIVLCLKIKLVIKKEKKRFWFCFQIQIMAVAGSNQRFEILSLLVRNVLTTNSKNFQLHGDKQIIMQVLPTAPDRAFTANECYDSSFDLGSIAYTDILQRLLRLGFQIQSSSAGSYSLPKPEKSIIKNEPQVSGQDTFVLQYTLVRTHIVG